MNKTRIALLVTTLLVAMLYQPNWVYENFWSKADFYDSIQFSVPYLVFLVIYSVITTCLCLPGSGALVMAIIGIVEGITYLSKSDEEFCRTYIVNRREWF